MAKKLNAAIIKQVKSSLSEIDANNIINSYFDLNTCMNFDIWKDGSYLIEAKKDIRDRHNGFEKAKNELEKYSQKLMLNGMKLPKSRLILDYESESIYDINHKKICALKDFDFDKNEDYENYDITYANGPNVAQQIYDRHGDIINDSNIFKYFSKGIDWYNPTTLTQQDFRLVLDLFNDPKTQKKRGAFYTPDKYIEISTKYLREAIKKCPKNKDYVILDRCAGSGQLEKLLSDEELSHCILSTIGIAEWVSLWNTYGEKVRAIIPPYVKGIKVTPKTNPNDIKSIADFDNNFIKGANALDNKYYQDNKTLWQDKYIIILENPPYADLTSNMHRKAKKGESNSSDIKKMMKGLGAVTNDLYSQFIWSAINIVKCDELIVYGPIKQWKINHLINYVFNKGHLCNRKYFHASESAIALQWYSRDNNSNTNKLYFTNDIDANYVEVKKIIKKYDIYEPHNVDREIIAKMVAQGGNRNMQGATIMSPHNKATSHVKYIDIDNLLRNIPLFVSNFWKDKDYRTKEVVMKSADGGKKFQRDTSFLIDCAIWTFFSDKTRCNSTDKFWKILNNKIKNNINSTLKECSKNILSYTKLSKDKIQNYTELNEWIGLYNIDKIYNKKVTNSYGKKVPVNDLLDLSIKDMKIKLNEFYESNIEKKMFKYELLK